MGVGFCFWNMIIVKYFTRSIDFFVFATLRYFCWHQSSPEQQPACQRDKALEQAAIVTGRSERGCVVRTNRKRLTHEEFTNEQGVRLAFRAQPRSATQEWLLRQRLGHPI